MIPLPDRTRFSWLPTLAALAFALPASAAEPWDPVPAEDLRATRARADSSAGAEALFYKVWVDDERDGESLRSVWRHYLRVKIHTAEAAQSFVRREVRFDDNSRVFDVVARTIQPDGRISVMSQKSVSKETRLRERGRHVRSIRFAPPEVRSGCIVEYRWRQVYDDFLMHYARFELQLENLPARRIRYHLKPLDIPDWFQRQMVFNARLPSKDDEGGYYIAEQENTRAFREEPFMPPERHVRPWLLVYYTDRKLETPEKFWRETGKEQAEWFDDWCRPNAELRRIAREATTGATDDHERLGRLAQWCRREFRAYSSDPDTLKARKTRANEHAREALQRRTGTLRDLDLLFAALARASGYDVRLALVPDRRDVLFTPKMMDLRFLSSYQIAVRVPGGWRSYNPQSSWLPWDMVPWNEEGQHSLVCGRDSSGFFETPIAEPIRSVRARRGELTLDENGDLSGDVHIRLTGHWNHDVREAIDSDRDTLAALRTSLGWEGTDVQLARFRMEHVPDEHEEFAGVVHLRLAGHAVPAGDRLLLGPTAWWSVHAPVFEERERKFPILFPFAWSDVDSLRIRLPDGWKVESLPATPPVTARGVSAYQMTLASAEADRVVECVRLFDMGLDGMLFFPVSSYGELRKLFELFTDRDRLTVPLSRVVRAP